MSFLLVRHCLLFQMANCVVIGVTTWILVERNYMSAVYGNVLMTVGGYLIVVGNYSFYTVWNFLYASKINGLRNVT